jgi:hypothetical protein
MGWWDAGDGALVGDQPLDALGAALAEVAASYQEKWNRPPSVDEWRKMLAKALRAHVLGEPSVANREGLLVSECPRRRLELTIEVVDVQ